MSSYSNRRSIFRKSVGGTTLGLGLVSLVSWYTLPISPWDVDEDEAPTISLLNQFLPQAEFAGEVSVNIHASPPEIMAALQSVTVEDMPIANWLGQLRYSPARILGQAQPSAPAATKPFMQVIQENGNIKLADEPNHEFVVGAIGKFHNLLDQQFVPLRTPDEFIEFNRPGYQKLAMSFKLTPLADGSGSRLTLTHGTHALSPDARLKFALYWLAIKPGGNFVSWLMLRAIKSIAEKNLHASDVVTKS